MIKKCFFEFYNKNKSYFHTVKHLILPELINISKANPCIYCFYFISVDVDSREAFLLRIQLGNLQTNGGEDKMV